MELHEKSFESRENLVVLDQKTTWKEFEKLIMKYGFELGFEEEYYGEWFGERIKDKIVLYYHEKKGLLLFAESYMNRNLVNQVKLFGELSFFSNELTKAQKYVLYHCSYSKINENSISFEISTKKNFFDTLNGLSKCFEFCKTFNYFPNNFHLLTSEEGLKKKLDFDEITQKRLAISNEKIKKILGI